MTVGCNLTLLDRTARLTLPCRLQDCLHCMSFRRPLVHLTDVHKCRLRKQKVHNLQYSLVVVFLLLSDLAQNLALMADLLIKIY